MNLKKLFIYKNIFENHNILNTNLMAFPNRDDQTSARNICLLVHYSNQKVCCYKDDDTIITLDFELPSKVKFVSMIGINKLIKNKSSINKEISELFLISLVDSYGRVHLYSSE
ncbi:MAG: hypothetical protein MHMPM18_004662 [Marteilia pararefringens]